MGTTRYRQDKDGRYSSLCPSQLRLQNSRVRSYKHSCGWSCIEAIGIG
uniref:Uncharacterized protein n=1 Tax=Brassica campestris TaxID=3711 RepID=A0A3P5YGY5_BRACM|nr:unnamed protein product [Brassica rapa]